MLNLVSLTQSSIQILEKPYAGRGMGSSEFLVESLIYKNPEQVMIFTKNLHRQLNLTRETRLCQKKLTMTTCRQIMMSSLFSRLMVDLEQSGTWILVAWSVISTFSLI